MGVLVLYSKGMEHFGGVVEERLIMPSSSLVYNWIVVRKTILMPMKLNDNTFNYDWVFKYCLQCLYLVQFR